MSQLDSNENDKLSFGVFSTIYPNFLEYPVVF